MENREYRLLAVDDDLKVLDAYVALFRQPTNVISFLLALTQESMEEAEGSDELAFSLECCDNGQEGVERIRQSLAENQPYAVVFLDMRMPNGWSGLETAIELRKLDTRVRIVLVSAYTDYSLEEIRSEIGPRFVFHTKPWDDDELKQLTRLLVSDWGYEQDLHEMQIQLQSASEEAIRANRAKDQFLAAMSHELRTPLTALLGYGELLSGSPLSTDQQQLLKTMLVSGSNLLYLLNDILDISKIAAGKFEIDQVEFELAPLLEEVESIFAVRAENQGLRFELIHDERTAEFSHLLLGDGKRISQVLINLVGNAVKFTHEGFVRLSVFSDQGQLHFKVEDSGIGIGAEAIKRLFTPFEQADNSISGRFGGTGLGLHISRTLATLMGGEITVVSEEGKGSCFTLVIPLQTTGPLHRVERKESESEAEIWLQGRVLLAEDTPELQMLIRRLIEPVGVTVDIADNGQQAFEKAMASNYDLVLMDMQMPVMNGIEATEMLRSCMNRTPIVALTANAMKHERDSFETAGCNGFLAKPVRQAELLAELSRHLEAGATPQKQEGTEEESNLFAPPYRVDRGRLDELDDDLKAFFFERVAVLQQELIKAREGGDRQEIRALVHNIKGSISSFGFMDIYDSAAEAQSMLDQGKNEGLEDLLDLVNQQMADILA